MEKIEIGLYLKKETVSEEVFAELSLQSEYVFVRDKEFDCNVICEDSEIYIRKNERIVKRLQYPFRAGELIDIISSFAITSVKRIFSFGDYKFDSEKSIIYKGEKQIKLTDKEANIIEYLCKEQNKSYSKDELLKDIWGYDEGIDTHTLESHIYRIRQKLDDDMIILNKDGLYSIGYKFELI